MYFYGSVLYYQRHHHAKDKTRVCIKDYPFTFGGLQCGSANAEYALALVLEEDHVSTNLKDTIGEDKFGMFSSETQRLTEMLKDH